MSDLTLQEIWKFDDADLGANRLGQLTEKQKKNLTEEHKSYKMVYAGIGVFVALIFCCLPIMMMLGRGILPLLISGSSQSSPADMIPLIAMGGFAVIFAIVAAVIVGGVLVVLYLRGSKKTDVAVKRAQGKINFVWVEKRVRNPSSKASPYKDIRVLELRIGDSKFEVNENLPSLLNEGDEWIIYYTSHPFKFLSAERVSKNG